MESLKRKMWQWSHKEGIAIVQKRWFYYDKECRAHFKYHCRSCQSDFQKEVDALRGIKKKEVIDMDDIKPISLVPLDVNDNSDAACQRAKSIEAFDKQVTMIQTVLGYDEKKMNSIKVAELGKITTKAKNEATVGHMKQLLKPPGFMEKLLCKIR